MIQTGAYLTAEAHTGKRDCLGLRKSVRFVAKAESLILQISGAKQTSIGIAIRPVEWSSTRLVRAGPFLQRFELSPQLRILDLGIGLRRIVGETGQHGAFICIEIGARMMRTVKC